MIVLQIQLPIKKSGRVFAVEEGRGCSSGGRKGEGKKGAGPYLLRSFAFSSVLLGRKKKAHSLCLLVAYENKKRRRGRGDSEKPGVLPIWRRNRKKNVGSWRERHSRRGLEERHKEEGRTPLLFSSRREKRMKDYPP